MGFIPGMQGWLCYTQRINKMKDKNQMTISIHARNTFDQIQYLSMIKKKKKLNKVNKRGSIPQLNKGHI